MKTGLNVLFHLLLITWNGYFLTLQIEDLIEGNLVGKGLFYFLLRAVAVIIFSISLLEMTRKKEID